MFASGTGISGPSGLAFDSGGNLFVANTISKTIEKITPGGTKSVFAAAGTAVPEFIAVRPVPEPSTLTLLAGGAALWAAGSLRKGQSPNAKV